MNIKHNLTKLLPKDTQALEPLTPPEVINGKVGRIDWGTEGSGRGAGQATQKPKQIPDEISCNLQPDIARATEFNPVELPNTQNVAGFEVLGMIEAPSVYKADGIGFNAFLNDAGELILETSNAQGVIDSVNQGTPELDLTTVGGGSKTLGLFRFMFDYDNRYYGSAYWEEIKANADGSVEYLVSATINLDRNFIRLKPDEEENFHWYAMRSGWVAGKTKGDTLFWSDLYTKFNEQIPPKEGMRENDLAYVVVSAFAHIGSSTATGFYWNYWNATNDASLIDRYVYSPGVRDFLKVTVAESGNITQVIYEHAANLEDYLPYVTHLGGYQAGRGYLISPSPVVVDYHMDWVFDFEIGREYASVLDITAGFFDGELERKLVTATFKDSTPLEAYGIGRGVRVGAGSFGGRYLPLTLDLKIKQLGTEATISKPLNIRYDAAEHAAEIGMFDPAPTGSLGDSPTSSRRNLSRYDQQSAGFFGFFNDAESFLINDVYYTQQAVPSPDLTAADIYINRINKQVETTNYPEGFANSEYDGLPYGEQLQYYIDTITLPDLPETP